MTALLVSALGAAASTAMLVTSAIMAGRERRRASSRARAHQRKTGTGAYAPTASLPRDVDLPLAIADHLRLQYRPIVAIHKAFGAGLLRAAAIAAAAHYRKDTTVHG